MEIVGADKSPLGRCWPPWSMSFRGRGWGGGCRFLGAPKRLGDAGESFLPLSAQRKTAKDAKKDWAGGLFFERLSGRGYPEGYLCRRRQDPGGGGGTGGRGR